MPRRFLFLLAALLPVAAMTAAAAESSSAPDSAPAATDPGYRLSAGDIVQIAVYNEPDLAATQTIARSGEMRLPLIGEIILAGKSVREAERAIENTYKERKFLKAPVVNITITAYFPREVSVLGSVRSPGTVVFPRDSTTLDIVEVITRVGGFLPVSKSNAVTITRRADDGKETITTVDLEKALSGRRQPGRESANVPIYPGDRIWVPERLF
ncbi:sugar transporter [Opitutaceae bacterium TAV5]|nr:sugar transporter [Opitutaceae bacterium TAV5]